MENKKILETAGKELEKKISVQSNFNQTLEGTRSNLLDALLLDDNTDTRKEFGNPIKKELNDKIKLAKKHKPPRTMYIENMKRIIKDLDVRIIEGQKTDDSRSNLVDLNKKETFNNAVLKSLVDEIIAKAGTTKDIRETDIFKKMTANAEHMEEVLWQLEHRKDELTDAAQIENIDKIISMFTKRKEDHLNKQNLYEKWEARLSKLEKDKNITFIHEGKTLILKNIDNDNFKVIHNGFTSMGSISNISKEDLLKYLSENKEVTEKEEEEVENNVVIIPEGRHGPSETEIKSAREEKLGKLKIGQMIFFKYKGKDYLIKHDGDNKFSANTGWPEELTTEKDKQITKEELVDFIVKNKEEIDHKNAINEATKKPAEEPKPEEKKPEEKPEQPEENKEEEKNVLWDLENMDAEKLIALKKKIDEMKDGSIIFLSTKEGVVKLKKENRWGFKVMTNIIDSLKPYVEGYEDSDSETKESWLAKENLLKYLDTFIKPIPVPVPDPIVPDPITENLELNAVISDMGTDVHRERVSLETEEELRDRYKKLGRYNLPQRMYLFLSRGAKRKRMIKEKMAAMAGKAFSTTGDATKDAALNEKTGNAADRHEVELVNKLDAVAKANSVTLQNQQVNDLCKEYLKGAITAEQFQTQFNTIIDNDAAIQNVLKGQKITHIGTNILEKLNVQRARRRLSQLVDTELTAYLSDNNQSHIDTINGAITAHIKHNQTNPEFMKDYQDFINKVPGAKEKLQQYLRHQGAVMKMQTTNLKMNIDILVKGKSAYQIDNKDRQKGLKYKVGHALDKLPRWLQTIGFIGLSVGTGLLTGGLGTVGAAIATTAVSATGVGGINALKKRTHYTKEQNTHEKNMVTDHKKEQEKLAERQDRALNGKRYQRKTYKAKRQLALYDQTTQENISVSNAITDTITDLSSKIQTLDTKEENYLKKNLIQGRARLKYYREIGHNFLASNEKEKIEEDMKRLEKSLILGVGKVGKTLPDIETMQATDDLGANLTYATVKKDLKSSYDKSTIQFKRERRNLAIKYGVGTAVLSAGMSIGMQYLFGTGVFSHKGNVATPGIEGKTATIHAKDTFDLGNSELLDSGTRNQIYNTGTNILHHSQVIDGSTITLNYGAGTDATQVLAGRLTPAVYEAKIQAVIHNINGMSLDQTTKTGLLAHIHNHPRTHSWGTQNFTNDALHGMRCAEVVEQAAKVAADSGRHNLIFNLNYDPSLDIAGKSFNNVAERVVNANFIVQTPSIPGTIGGSTGWDTLGRMIQIPVFFNTFKDRVEGKKAEEKPAEGQAPTDVPQGKTTPIKDKKGYYDDKNEGYDPMQDKEGKIFDPITGRRKPKNPILDNSKIRVSTRKEKINDLEDFSPEYPRNFKEKSLDEIAQEVISNPNIRLYEDPNFVNDSKKARELRESGDKKGAIEEIKRIITQERENIRKDIEKQGGLIDETYAAVKKTFETYKVKDLENTLPSKNKIHFMCKYEFEAYYGNSEKENGGTTRGTCQILNGNILINYDVIHMQGKTPEMIGAMIKDVVIHELVHDSGVNNYHHYYTLKDKTKANEKSNRENEQFINRRIGLQMIRRVGGKKDLIMIYGGAMNEAVTQMLADEIGKDILPSNYQSTGYPKEKEVIRLIETKFNIPFEMFAKAILNRTRDNEEESNALKALNEKINGIRTIDGQKGFERPEFLKLIMCIMDFESKHKAFGADYTITKALINGEQVVVTSEMKKFLHPSLLLKDEKTGVAIRSANGDLLIKQGILDAYPNLLDTAAHAMAA